MLKDYSPRRVFAVLPVLCLVFCLGRTAPAPGQTTPPAEAEDKTVETLAARTDAFFNNLKSPAVTSAAALDEILAGSLIAQNGQRKELAAKIDAIPKQFGKLVEAERIETKRVGRDVVVLKYLYKTERFPIVWHFIFYRDPTHPATGAENGNWMIVSLGFNTQVESLIE